MRMYEGRADEQALVRRQELVPLACGRRDSAPDNDPCSRRDDCGHAVPGSRPSADIRAHADHSRGAHLCHGTAVRLEDSAQREHRRGDQDHDPNAFLPGTRPFNVGLPEPG